MCWDDFMKERDDYEVIVEAAHNALQQINCGQRGIERVPGSRAMQERLLEGMVRVAGRPVEEWTESEKNDWTDVLSSIAKDAVERQRREAGITEPLDSPVVRERATQRILEWMR